MRVILSRKGFDSAYGRVPSPILPDGRAVWLPIPSIYSRTTFRMIRQGSQPTAARLAKELTRGLVHQDDGCHLDPDLDAASLTRPAGWKAAFGQVGAAQRHLENEGVGAGDVFLFFGWFRQVKLASATPAATPRWRYRQDAPDVHRLFGYLQVGEVLKIGTDMSAVLAAHPYLIDHPHLHYGISKHSNTIYTATDELVLPGGATGLPGAGTFATDEPRWTLSDPAGPGRSHWRLPAWVAHAPKGLSYHRNGERWETDAHHARVRTVGRGQEFVLDCGAMREAADWIESLVRPSKAGTAAA